ncbi:iron ABC transporter ATP-binding protein [Cryobacterium tepidiphilum]|uniref:Iron ABC transporter ATP-binding protein n=1 Tax=Cryobacterium tepidiphilum TaxID=2486026 RepID=A0A3M8LDT4_9MICO|nr:iron ABC transporter ATP-binding protein [Cryobacterium tepidiphilum]
MPRRDRFPRLFTGLAVTGAVALITLTGCSADSLTPSASTTNSSTPAPDAAATAGATPSPTDAPEPTPAATPTPTPTPSGDPVGLGCDDVLSPDDIYAFNPNFGTAPDYQPTGVVATAPAYGGVACGWMNQSSRALLEVSVATPTDDALEDLKNKAAASGKAVPTYGTPPEVEAYFSKSGETGTVQVFFGTYWVVTSSVVFYEPGDAQKLIDMIQSNLG